MSDDETATQEASETDPLIGQSHNNPARNVLSRGIKPEELAKAVISSGYPLQSVVAKALEADFAVTEEWGYREGNESRSLDIYAYKRLKDGGQFHPSLLLLIECKQSELPFVFFESVTKRSPYNCPRIAALRQDTVELAAQKTYRYTPVAECLGLHETEFMASAPPLCNAFAKVHNSGKLKLSGDDIFKSIIMPLTSALRFVLKYFKSTNDLPPYYPVLVLPLCVIRAPLVLASLGPDGESQLRMEPWVRLHRFETIQTPSTRDQVHYTYDFVQAEFLRTYIKDHLLPFGQRFCDRVFDQSQILVSMKGEVDDLSSWKWQDIRPVEHPSTKP